LSGCDEGLRIRGLQKKWRKDLRIANNWAEKIEAIITGPSSVDAAAEGDWEILERLSV